MFIFSVQEFIHPRLMSTESEHSVSKNRALQMGAKTQNGDFLKNSSNFFDSVSVINEDHIPK
jgi:hypothetical protein